MIHGDKSQRYTDASKNETHAAQDGLVTVFAFGNMESGALGDGMPLDDEGTSFPARYLVIGIPSKGPMKGKEIVQIDAGKATSYFLSREGRVYATGWNWEGSLGAGWEKLYTAVTPIEIPPPDTDMYGKRIIQLSAGQTHALFLDEHGCAYAVGGNSRGQLAILLPTNTSLHVPRMVHTYYELNPDDMNDAEPLPERPTIRMVAAGYYQSFFIDESGDVFAGGGQIEGASGLGLIPIDVHLPIKLASAGSLVGVKVDRISSGAHHTLFLDSNGVVWSVGFGGFGQLGNGKLESLRTPQRITDFLGEQHPLYNVTMSRIAVGAFHSIFITTSGHVFAVGANEFGVIGKGYTSALVLIPYNMSEYGELSSERIVEVACGEDFAMFQTELGDLYHVGSNRYGQSGRNIPDPFTAIAWPTWRNVTGFAVGASFAFVLDKSVCEAGFTLPDIYATECAPCPEGHYCQPEYTYYSPKVCPEYTWNFGAASTVDECTNEHCGEGFICRHGARDPCSPGEWSALGMPTQCNTLLCGAGHICRDGIRKPCPVDTWTEFIGAQECTPCPARKICDGNGKITDDRSLMAILSMTEVQVTVGIIAGFIVTAALLVLLLGSTAVLVLLYCLLRMRRMVVTSDKRIKLLQDYLQPEDEEDANRARLLIKNSLLEIDYSEISIERKIGSGGSDSVVLLGKWKGMPVAVKVFKVNNLSGEKTYDAYERELSVMVGLRHPNLVTLLGCCLNFPRLALVMEYCAQGSLAQCIASGRFAQYSISTVYSIIRNMCAAVQFLHSREVLHRDIKCDNIFLAGQGSEVIAKLGDFGLSRVVAQLNEDSLATNSIVGSFYYCAPEITNRQPYNGKADVFSFGIVLYEMFTNRVNPYPECTPLMAQFRTAENPNFRPDITKVESGPFGDKAWILEQCWHADPEQRPDFDQLREYFKDEGLEASREDNDLMDQVFLEMPQGGDIEMDLLF